MGKTTGTTIGISATLPETYDSAGYGAVGLVFTEIGKVIDVGGIKKTYNLITEQLLKNRYPTKEKDTYDISNVPLNLSRSIADAGQVLLQEALDSDNSYSFEVVYPSGNIENFTAKVIELGVGSAASGGFESVEVSIAIDPQSLVEA